MLFNVGFKEAIKDLDWDCVVFHDVDHIPENDRNYYGCGQMPRHFATKLDKYMYMWVSYIPQILFVFLGNKQSAMVYLFLSYLCLVKV